MAGGALCILRDDAGGMGARPGLDGASAIHTHMTNSWNTPIEVFEQAIRSSAKVCGAARSGGSGPHRGGDGIIREIELLYIDEVGFLGIAANAGRMVWREAHAGKPGANTAVTNGAARRGPSGKCAIFVEAGSPWCGSRRPAVGDGERLHVGS